MQRKGPETITHMNFSDIIRNLITLKGAGNWG